MTAATFGIAITATATAYSFPQAYGSYRGVFELDGTFGGCTVTPGYDDGSGNFVAFRDATGTAITCTSSIAWEVVLPTSGKLAVSLSGGSGISLVAMFKGLH